MVREGCDKSTAAHMSMSGRKSVRFSSLRSAFRWRKAVSTSPGGFQGDQPHRPAVLSDVRHLTASHQTFRLSLVHLKYSNGGIFLI